jgi:hypothetical protein
MIGVWLPDGWMESAPAGFPLPPLIPPGPSFSSHCGERRGEEIGVWGRWLRRRPQTTSFLPLPALRSGGGEGAGGRGEPLTSVGFCHRDVNAWTEDARGRLGGGPPLPQKSFFQPFPCPVKWVSISQGLPLLCLRAPDEAENRQALWNQYDSTGQVKGLKERSRMEGSPSTPPPCLSPEKPTRVRGAGGRGEPRGSGGQDAG